MLTLHRRFVQDFCAKAMERFYIVRERMVFFRLAYDRQKGGKDVRFSDIQKKEVIDAIQGAFLGYVQDATINVEEGVIEHLHVSGEERGGLFEFKKSDVLKIKMEAIEIIGKEIILVRLNRDFN